MGGRLRAAWATVTSAPWRRAPWLLWRRPGVLVTVAGACAVVAAALAAVPLYLSSAGTASVALQAAERCPRDTGVTLALQASADEVQSPVGDPFGPLADRLGPSSRWIRTGRTTLAGGEPARSTQASVLVRDGALDHVEVVDGPRGDGVWLPDRASELTGLRAGDRATIDGVEVPVAGVFRDPAGSTVDDYWCSNADLLLVQARSGDLVLPPPVVLADRATFAGLMGALDLDVAEGAWEAPLRDGLTVDEARDLVPVLACSRAESAALGWCDGGRPPLGYSGRLGRAREAVYARDDADFVERYLHSHLPFVTRRSQAIETSVAGGIWPVAGFAALAGVGLVAASASLWSDRRRRELTLLTVRGVSPAALGLKGVLELSIPSVAGSLAGVAVAYLAVVTFGPSPVLDTGAVDAALAVGLVALGLAAVTVWAVVTTRARAQLGHGRRRVRLGVLPVELALVFATLVSYRRLGDWGIPVGRGGNVSRVDVWGLMFPVLFLVTAVALLSRVLTFSVRPLRAASRSWPTALYLGVRRVARYRVAVIGLVAASAVAAGVLGYAATMNRSLDATLETKAMTFVGSDAAVRLPRDGTVPSSLSGRATEVHVYQDAWVGDAPRESAAVLAIDPATFGQAVLWDATFSSTSLQDVLDRLAAPVEDGRIPAVVLGAPGATVEVSIRGAGSPQFTATRLNDVRAFPGMRRSEVTVVVAAAALEGLGVDGGRAETWIRGDRAATLDALDRAGTTYAEDRRHDEVADGASFRTVTWTFGFMQSLGLAAGLLSLGGVAIYLDARRRDRVLGYAFMRRMGLRRAQHRRALLVELAASVLVGCWVGLGIALVAASLAHGRIDPVPSFHPGPVLRPAMGVVVGLVAVSTVVAVVGAVLAQRRVDLDDPLEVLRAGL